MFTCIFTLQPEDEALLQAADEAVAQLMVYCDFIIQ